MSAALRTESPIQGQELWGSLVVFCLSHIQKAVDLLLSLCHFPGVAVQFFSDYFTGLPAMFLLRVKTLLQGELVSVNYLSALPLLTVTSWCAWWLLWHALAAWLLFFTWADLPCSWRWRWILRWLGCLMAKLLSAWPLYFLLLHLCALWSQETPMRWSSLSYIYWIPLVSITRPKLCLTNVFI